jgi:hypothetical protein
VRRAASGGGEVVVEMTLESEEFLEVGDAVPLEVGHVLALHSVDLGDGEEVLTDDRPRGIRVGVVAEGLARAEEHNRRGGGQPGGSRRSRR